MNGQSNIVKIVAQAGLAGVAVFTLYILWNLMGNHLSHNTQALQEVSKSLESVSGSIQEMNTLHIEQTRVLQRLERVLDK